MEGKVLFEFPEFGEFVGCVERDGEETGGGKRGGDFEGCRKVSINMGYGGQRAAYGRRCCFDLDPFGRMLVGR